MSNGKSSFLSLIRLANRKTKNSRVLRRIGIRTYTTVVRANVFFPPPRVLLNGPPKSGTHLLSDCLSSMPRMMYSGRHFALPDFHARDRGTAGAESSDPEVPGMLDRKRLTKFLKRCPRGMFVTAHARHHPVLRDLVEELGFRHILLLRDPRDIVISHVFYLKRETLHHHHRYYTEQLSSDEERIAASIRGFERNEVTRGALPSVREAFGAYLPWMEDPSVLVVRFEDLIGPQGGEDSGRQLAQIERIGKFVGRPLEPAQVQQVARKMYGTGSLTFRKGRTGDWREHFTEAHKLLFKEVAGDLLIELGYEKDTDW